MLIPSLRLFLLFFMASLSRRVNANSQRRLKKEKLTIKLIKKGEC